MTDDETMRLTAVPTEIAPDGSDVRVRLGTRRAASRTSRTV